MTQLRRLAWALYLALSYSSYSNSQELVPGDVYTTGNIVIPTTTSSGSTWTNGVYQDQLSCWAGGDTGYCGPNAIIRPGNNINFSYGSTYIYQQQHITGVLPGGSGLQVNGYNFSFTAKNGNGWDGGNTDSLMALVRFWDNTNGRGANNLLYGNVYSLNYKFDWTNFNYNETFTKPLDVTSIGQVQYGFIGRDNNGWAGPYGPELTNVSFKVKYSVDPCASNPMYSTSCPGYLEALAKLTPLAPASPPPAPPPVAVAEAPPPVANMSQPPPPPSQGPAPAVTTATPSANNPQPKAGEVASSSSKPTVSMSTIMSILSTESAKVGAVEKSVVQQAVSEAQKAGEQATQQAEAVAGTLTTQSVTSSMAQTTSTSKVSVANNTQTSVAALSITQSNMSQVGIRPQYQVNNIDTGNTQLSVGSMTSSNSYQLSVNRNSVAVETEIPQAEGIKFGSRSVLSDYLNAKAFMSMMGSEQLQDGTVKRNVQPNEVAGGVDINNIATQPKGYEAYSVATLPDTQFYKVDSIYKNQNTVDNVRVLRGLTGGSDRLHQEMIDQQYKGK